MTPASRTALSSGLHFGPKPAVKTNLMVVGQREFLALRSAFCTFHTIPLIYIQLGPRCSLVSLHLTHFAISVSVLSCGCILIRCCLKLSNLGHSLSRLGQLSPKHLYSLPWPCSGWIL